MRARDRQKIPLQLDLNSLINIGVGEDDLQIRQAEVQELLWNFVHEAEPNPGKTDVQCECLLQVLSSLLKARTLVHHQNLLSLIFQLIEFLGGML